MIMLTYFSVTSAIKVQNVSDTPQFEVSQIDMVAVDTGRSRICAMRKLPGDFACSGPVLAFLAEDDWVSNSLLARVAYSRCGKTCGGRDGRAHDPLPEDGETRHNGDPY